MRWTRNQHVLRWKLIGLFWGDNKSPYFEGGKQISMFWGETNPMFLWKKTTNQHVLRGNESACLRGKQIPIILVWNKSACFVGKTMNMFSGENKSAYLKGKQMFEEKIKLCVLRRKHAITMHCHFAIYILICSCNQRQRNKDITITIIYQ